MTPPSAEPPPCSPAPSAAPEPDVAPGMRGALPEPRRLGARLGVSLMIGAFFAWLMHAGAMPLVPSSAQLAHVRWWTLLGYVAGWSLVHVLRAGRWKLLLAPLADVSLRRIFV